MRPILQWSAAVLLAASVPSAQAVTADFDALLLQPPVTGVDRLVDANGSSTYLGIVWDTRFRVVGDEYRIQADAPAFAVPHSGHYFATNESSSVGGAPTDDGLLITTTLVLTEAWFGQNEYYGFGGGADQITIHALSGNTVLASVIAGLPNANPGLPEPLAKVDTSAFLGLTGITGYRIDRHERNEFATSWVADDFVFAAPVPEPGVWALVMVGGVAVAWRGLRRR